MSFSVAIDGPAGSGKSTIAKLVAEKSGLVYVDTGAMYRAIGLYFLEKGIDINDEEKINRDIEKIDVQVKYEDGIQKIFLNDDDVTSKIRTEEVSWAASTTSKYQKVRTRMVLLQQELAKKYDVIMEGRDIGSVVLPDANLKIFLTADEKTRAKRRYLELQQKNVSCTEKEILEDMKKRDLQDTTRANSPLVQVEGAILLDTTGLSIEEVLAKIMKLITERRG